MSGFDVDVARYVARNSATRRTRSNGRNPSAQRETLISNDQVKFIVATYSITDARAKQKGRFRRALSANRQSLLVKADNTDISGPESLQNQQEAVLGVGIDPGPSASRTSTRACSFQQYDTYSACVGRCATGPSTPSPPTRLILAGYAAKSPGEFERSSANPFLRGALRHRTEEGRLRTAGQDQRRVWPDGSRTAPGRRPSRRTSVRRAGCTGAAADRQGTRAEEACPRSVRFAQQPAMVAAAGMLAAAAPAAATSVDPIPGTDSSSSEPISLRPVPHGRFGISLESVDQRRADRGLDVRVVHLQHARSEQGRTSSRRISPSARCTRTSTQR